jgi:hypothetical protein
VTTSVASERREPTKDVTVNREKHGRGEMVLKKREGKEIKINEK